MCNCPDSYVHVEVLVEEITKAITHRAHPRAGVYYKCDYDVSDLLSRKLSYSTYLPLRC